MRRPDVVEDETTEEILLRVTGLDMVAVREVLANDKHRILQIRKGGDLLRAIESTPEESRTLDCGYPGCKKSLTGKPRRLHYVPVSSKQYNIYLCPEHNRCFYCKRSNADFLRLCKKCAIEREARHRLKALPPPLKNEMTDFIKAKHNLPRPLVHVISRYLNRIDQLMWAIACGASWKRQAKFADMARRYGSPRQTLWLLKQGCLPVTKARKMVEYLQDHHTEEEGMFQIRCYHAAAKRKRFCNVMSNVNLLGWALVVGYRRKEEMEKMKSKNSSEGVIERRDEDPYAFFKWNFLQLNSRSLRASLPGDEDSCLGLIIAFREVDLIIWLKQNRCIDRFASDHTIREAEACQDSALLAIYYQENSSLVKSHMRKVITYRFECKRWYHLRAILMAGIPLPSGFITYDRWEQLISSMVYQGPDNDLWHLIELMAELHQPIDVLDWNHLIHQKAVAIVARLLELGFKAPSATTSLVIELGDIVIFELFLQHGTELAMDHFLSICKRSNLEMLKLTVKYGKKFNSSDLILLRTLGKKEVIEWLIKECCLPGETHD